MNNSDLQNVLFHSSHVYTFACWKMASIKVFPIMQEFSPWIWKASKGSKLTVEGGRSYRNGWCRPKKIGLNFSQSLAANNPLTNRENDRCAEAKRKMEQSPVGKLCPPVFHLAKTRRVERKGPSNDFLCLTFPQFSQDASNL